MARNEQAVSEKEQVEMRERKWLKPSKRAAGYAEELIENLFGTGSNLITTSSVEKA